MQTVGKVEFNKPAKLLQRAQTVLSKALSAGDFYTTNARDEVRDLLAEISREIGTPQDVHALDIHSVKINIGRVETHNVD